MNAARFDFSSDYMIFFASLLFVMLIIAVALERYSPSRQNRRKVRRPGSTTDQPGDLID